MTKEQFAKKALRAASRKLPYKSDKAIKENLSFFCDDLAHAYRVGAEEAQREIVNRLIAVGTLETQR